jgi:hypothetical protein
MKDDEFKEFAVLELDREIVAPAYLKQRWHDSIDAAARREYNVQQLPRRQFQITSFLWGAAIAATLAVGIGIGVFVSGGTGTIEPTSYAVHDNLPLDAGNSGSLARTLQVHLRDTQDDIARLSTDADADRTTLVLQIIQQNRLYERAAERNDANNLARVLRAFEPILLQLAASDIAPADAKALRAQLAFELQIMLTKLENDASKETQTT